MKRVTTYLPLILALLMLLPVSRALAQETRPVVVKVDIEGNRRIGTERLRNYLRLRKGYRYDPEVLNADIQRLWQLEGIDHVEADVQRVKGGVEITFRVREKQLIEDIRIRGNHRLWKSTIRDVITHPREDYLRPYEVKRDVEAIKTLYKEEEGLLFVTVNTYIDEYKKKTVLVYEIAEGPRSAVRKIVISGNKRFSDKRLKELVEHGVRRFPALIWRGYYEEEKFQEDVRRIIEYYRNNGFLDAVVGGYPRFSDDLKRIELVVLIHEGKRYRTEWVKFQGNELFADDELMQEIPLKPGRPFSPEKLQQSRRRIGRKYSEIGYLDADPAIRNDGVTATTIYDPDKGTVRVTFRIDEGPRVFLREIRITGNTKTKPNVIRRELRFYPGEAVNMERVRASQQRLVKTGYFDFQSPNPVQVTFEPEGEAIRDAIVKVREGRTGQFEFGVGYSTTSAIIGDISFTDRNFDIFDWPKDWDDLFSGNAFRGAGHIVQLRLMPGSRGQTYLLSFDNPSVYDTKYSFGTTLRYAITDYRNYDDRRAGVELRGGYRLTDWEVVRLAFGLEDIKISDIRDEAPQDFYDAEGRYLNPYVRVGWQKDKVKLVFPYLPASGYELKTDVTFSMLDLETIKWTGSAIKYFTLWDPDWWGTHVLSLRSSGGVVTSYGDGVPVFDRLWAGGIGSLRGFRVRGIGPFDFVDREQVGGRGLFLASAQYGMPVAKNYLRLVAFTDVGWLGSGEGDIVKGYEDMRMSVGVGLRLRLPLLGRAVFAFDYAMPIIKEDFDSTQEFQWAITGGSTF